MVTLLTLKHASDLCCLFTPMLLPVSGSEGDCVPG